MSNALMYPTFVNAYQSADERAAKYRFCRELGFNPHEAARLRDWDMRFITWFYERWIAGGKTTDDFSKLRHEIGRERAAEFTRLTGCQAVLHE